MISGVTLPRSRDSDPERWRGRSTPSPAAAEREDRARDDRELVARICQGDGGALEALYARYGRACYSLARRVLADDQFAQDCVQEVFLTVWRDASRFDATRGGFSSWLLSMTHHKAVDTVRREELRRRRNGTDDPLETRESDRPGVHDEVWTTLRGERVRAALRTLPEAQREALTLAYFGGYTQREIAGLTGTPLGTVKTRMLTGMRRLRGSLDGLRDSAVLDAAPGLAAGSAHPSVERTSRPEADQ